MRSAAEGEHRTGEDVGEAVPLMPLEAIQPFGKGEVKGNARRACSAASRASTDAGCNPKGVAKLSAERGLVVGIVVVRLLLFLPESGF